MEEFAKDIPPAVSWVEFRTIPPITITGSQNLPLPSVEFQNPGVDHESCQPVSV